MRSLCHQESISRMSPHAIHLRSYSPDLKVEFDLPPGTHARIGASPQSEVTLPLTGIAPFWCMLGRFQNGRLFLADPNGLILRRIDLPETLSLPPYEFVVFNPADAPPDLPQPAAPVEPSKPEPSKFQTPATAVLVIAAVAAAIAVSQCGKPATLAPTVPVIKAPPFEAPAGAPKTP